VGRAIQAQDVGEAEQESCREGSTGLYSTYDAVTRSRYGAVRHEERKALS